jgi:hypothetical protein
MLDFTYSMVLRRPWLWGEKVYDDWGTNLITIEGNDICKNNCNNQSGEGCSLLQIFIGYYKWKRRYFVHNKPYLFSMGGVVLPTYTQKRGGGWGTSFWI